MARESPCPINSRWRSKTGGPRVFVVRERKPFGVLVMQEEGRAYFGETRQRDLLASFERLLCQNTEEERYGK